MLLFEPDHYIGISIYYAVIECDWRLDQRWLTCKSLAPLEDKWRLVDWGNLDKWRDGIWEDCGCRHFDPLPPSVALLWCWYFNVCSLLYLTLLTISDRSINVGTSPRWIYRSICIWYLYRSALSRVELLGTAYCCRSDSNVGRWIVSGMFRVAQIRGGSQTSQQLSHQPSLGFRLNFQTVIQGVKFT